MSQCVRAGVFIGTSAILAMVLMVFPFGASVSSVQLIATTIAAWRVLTVITGRALRSYAKVPNRTAAGT